MLNIDLKLFKKNHKKSKNQVLYHSITSNGLKEVENLIQLAQQQERNNNLQIQREKEAKEREKKRKKLEQELEQTNEEFSEETLERYSY